MRFIYLTAATYSLSLIFGLLIRAMSLSAFLLNALSSFTGWLQGFERIAAREKASASLCNDCGSFFLFTVEFFSILGIFYLVVLSYELVFRVKKGRGASSKGGMPKQDLKALTACIGTAILFLFVIWSVLFSAFAFPSARSPSMSDFSTQGLTLFFLVNTLFHAEILLITAGVSVAVLRPPNAHLK